MLRHYFPAKPLECVACAARIYAIASAHVMVMWSAGRPEQHLWYARFEPFAAALCFAVLGAGFANFLIVQMIM